jgi:uncharacterized Ntn-hydrolase superfamily protein
MMKRLLLPVVLTLIFFCKSTSAQTGSADPVIIEPPISTFSIVAYDPESGDYGIAVQSRYFAVGEVVPHAAADTGAIATQARGNLQYGADGLKLLAQGMAADKVIEQLISTDPLRDERQVAIIDQRGIAASFTGKGCLPWAGERTGENYAVLGNLLTGPHVVDAMATAFETAPGDFATRLVYAIAAGQAAGGDARGRQSAALLVVRKNGGYLGLTDRYINLHVEDHPTPIRELARLLKIRQAQLATGKARQLLQQATESEGAKRTALIAQAREHMQQALQLHPQDDYGWWLLASIYVLEDQPGAAAEAAQRALLENPAWRRLPASTRASLGVEPELIEALLEVDSFKRVWHSLAPEESSAQ